MWCHPSHGRTPSFFKMVIAPPTSIIYKIHPQICAIADQGLLTPLGLRSAWSGAGTAKRWGSTKRPGVGSIQGKLWTCFDRGLWKLDKIGSLLLQSPTTKDWLVVWNIFWSIYWHTGNVIIPTDELIFFRGVETTNKRYFLPELPIGAGYEFHRHLRMGPDKAVISQWNHLKMQWLPHWYR